jgi:LacI family transcriptional regulator
VGSLPDAYPSIRERREGFLQAVEDYGLEPYFADCVLHPSVIEPCVIDLLTSHPQVTALFGCNDDVAIGSMRVAQQLGKRIPDDLSIIGFDNIELSHMVHPGLTTMRIDMLGMGRFAAQMLQNRLAHPESNRVRLVTCPNLVERDSVTSPG